MEPIGQGTYLPEPDLSNQIHPPLCVVQALLKPASTSTKQVQMHKKLACLKIP
jgi:hypothetical protein